QNIEQPGSTPTTVREAFNNPAAHGAARPCGPATERGFRVWNSGLAGTSAPDVTHVNAADCFPAHERAGTKGRAVMAEAKQNAKGMGERVAGKAREIKGAVTGNTSDQVAGKGEQMKGKARQAVARASRAAKK